MSGFWQAFRRWRRSRPFWGGLFLLLAGAELFLSGNMDLGNIQVHLGPEGFLSYLLPLILVVCGLLVWLTPAQRLFYAIVAAITAVYSLIGLNLGGFFLGMLLGMVGAALAFGWQPRPQPEAQPAAAMPPEEAPAGGGPDEEPHADENDPTPVYDAVFGDNYARPRHATPNETPTEQLNYGQLPRGGQRPDGGYQPDGDYEPEGGYRPEERGHGGPGTGAGYAVLLLLALTLAAGAVAVFHAASAAVAAPSCPTTKPAPPKGTEPSRSGATPSASPSASPSPSPSAAAADGGGDGGIVGDIIGGIADGLGKLLGGGDQQAAPEATPTPSPTATGIPGGQPGPRKSTSPCGGSTTAPGKPGGNGGKVKANTVIPPPPGQPVVQSEPSKLTGSKVVMNNLQYDGLVDLPTYNGTIRVMQFSMDKSVTDDFKLLTRGPDNKIVQLTSTQLTVDGDVKFFCTKFGGNLVGVAPITFTVDSPPPAILVPVIDFLPVMVFTKPEIDLAFVTTKKLTADDLLGKPA